ncbi:MAG: hypothetical protein H8D75_02105 [Rhodospirillaceae bacterium]|nr:hypothetical protein [Rhodospirillaceae bacterium]
MSNSKDGWSWFGIPDGALLEGDRELALSFARCFRDADGKRVLEHLRAMTLEQSLGPAASDAMLRHLEGQRQLITHIHGLIERGRGNPTMEKDHE